MKKVRGYLTNDDVFFGTKEEAELHEATRMLELSCSLMHLRTAAVLTVIDELSLQIERYINAKRRVNKHPTDNNPSEADTVSVLELSPRGFESVSYIRDSKRPEEVRHYSPLDGIGGGGDDASGVRGSEDLATPAHPRIPEALRADSEEDIRDREVDALRPRESRK